MKGDEVEEEPQRRGSATTAEPTRCLQVWGTAKVESII